MYFTSTAVKIQYEKQKNRREFVYYSVFRERESRLLICYIFVNIFFFIFQNGYAIMLLIVGFYGITRSRPVTAAAGILPRR
jgi:hypothetical protein